MGDADVITRGGEMGRRMRAVDWSATALGPVSSWPQNLRAALGICVSSRFPIAIYWGPDLVLLYNDAWSPILGGKHPASLDAPFSLLYVVDARGVARLAAHAGVSPGAAAPDAISLVDGDGDAAWPLAHANRTRRIEVVDGLRERFPGLLSGGPWPEAPGSAFVVPIVAAAAEPPTAFLVLGASPRRAIDAGYTRFVETAASQLAASFASARRRDDLAELDRAKTVFFSNVSHEFRTPLTLMLGPMEDAIASPEHALRGEDLDTAHRNAMRLQKLVNALLDFSRIEAGRVQAAYEKTDLAAFTAELASVFRSAVERAGLRFRVATSALPFPTYVDRDMWEKIVLNLLSNALKFTLEGEIEVTLAAEADGAVLRVRDTGTGIATADLPHVFERFHRIRNDRARTHEGSGIGLALVSELVKLHGGTLGVASVDGEGTTFEVRIPGGHAHSRRTASSPSTRCRASRRSRRRSSRRRCGASRRTARHHCDPASRRPRARAPPPKRASASSSPTTTPTCASTSRGSSRCNGGSKRSRTARPRSPR